MWDIFRFFDDIFSFLTTLNLKELTRTFWYIFYFEFIRYIVLDVFVIVTNVLYPKHSAKAIENARRQLHKENALVSIIVPGKNEGKHIYTLIRSLDYQTYKNFELIVIDDGSDDNTAEYCQSFVKSGKIKTFIRNEIRGGKASAANHGAKIAKGKYIIHLDADSSMAPDALEEILMPFYLDVRTGAVGGNVMARNYDKNSVTLLQAQEYVRTIMLSRIVSDRLGIYRTVSGAFGAFRADILERIGYWDIGPGLDGDITMKIRKLHLKVHFAEKAICRTNVPENLWALTKQRLRWNKSIVRFRVIKHFDVFIPNKNFSFSNMQSSFENIFFNIIVLGLWWIYVIQMIYINPALLIYAFTLKLMIYGSLKILKNLLISYLLDHNEYVVPKFWSLLPLMLLYDGVYMKLVRTFSYILETFEHSYKDPWNPEKTSKQAKIHGL